MFFLQIKKTTILLTIICSIFLTLTGCKAAIPTPGGVTPSTQTQAITFTPEASATFTPTPQPLALRVNGEGVPLAEYEAQMVQLRAADEQLGLNRTEEEQRQLVLDDLINQTLLAQMAIEGGFVLDDTDMQEKLDSLIQSLGGETALETWISANGYTKDSFLGAIRRAAASAWQRDVVISTVPESMEQIRGQQILVRSQETAEAVHRQLEAGAEFSTLASQYDPITAGILGWFPRGYLTQKAVEEAAFALKPGEFSPIIETNFGYHILYVMERENDRLLSQDARTTLQHNVLGEWIESMRQAASIEIIIP